MLMSLFLLPRQSCPAPGCPCAMLWSTWLGKMSSTLSAGNLVFPRAVGTRCRQDSRVLSESVEREETT